MKMKLIIIIVLSILIRCQKESVSKNEINSSNLLGTWVNVLINQDTIQITDSLIKRRNIDAKCFCHLYKYYIKEDSIVLTYLGLDKIAILPYHKKIFLNKSKDSLTVRNLNIVYPSIQGEIFRKL